MTQSWGESSTRWRLERDDVQGTFEPSPLVYLLPHHQHKCGGGWRWAWFPGPKWQRGDHTPERGRLVFAKYESVFRWLHFKNLSTFFLTIGFHYLNLSPFYYHGLSFNYKAYSRRLVQDGGVEGCALTPSHESTEITANCWTIVDRKTLELTKKDTPHPKTKEKPQWDGRKGAITIKSDPITSGWVTHKLENTYTTEVHPLEWRFWAPHQASQPGGPRTTGGGIPRESDFESYRDLTAGLRQDWEKQRLHSWMAHTK